MLELLALLDLGSNAARFVLARINPGVGYRVLQKERIQTRLADGRAGELPPDAIALTLSSVSGFLERLGINGAPASTHGRGDRGRERRPEPRLPAARS